MSVASASSAHEAKLVTGAPMPLLGLGTWRSAPGEVKAAVISAIESGYRHIDCAAIYGNEKEIGEALHDVFARGVLKREELFITSKLWASKCQPENVEPALAQTLEDLKLSYLDLYLIHWPFFFASGASFPPAEGQAHGYKADAYLAVWREMEKLVDAGKARAIGTSNMSAKKLSELLPHARVQPSVNQVECHPYLAQQRLKKYCDEHKIVLTAYSPLGSPDRPGVKSEDPTPMADPVVKSLAEAHGATVAQVLVAFQMRRGIVAIPKSVHAERIRSNFEAVKVADKLTDADISALLGLDGQGRLIKGMAFVSPAQPTWQDLWDEDWEKEHVGL